MIAHQRAVFALLTEKFHLRPWEIARLTDRQISQLYFHPRKDGEIIFPFDEVEVEEQPLANTLEDELKALDDVKDMMNPGDYRRAVEELRRLYERREHHGVDGPEPGAGDDGG